MFSFLKLVSLSTDRQRTEQWTALFVGESHRKWKKLSLTLFCVSVATVFYWQVVLIKTGMFISCVLIVWAHVLQYGQGQVAGTTFLLPPYGSGVLNSGHQAEWRVCLHLPYS